MNTVTNDPSEVADLQKGNQALGDPSRVVRRIGYFAVVCALASVTFTYLILTGLTPIEPTGSVLWTALIINTGLVLLLIGALGWEVAGIWNARRKGRAAARLHIRTVLMFSIIATLPAMLVALVASITLNQGLDRWFEDRTRAIVGNARTVARAYVEEHGKVLRGDLIGMAADIDRANQIYNYNPTRFDVFFETQALLRKVPGAFLLEADGTVITRTILDPKMKFEMPPTISLAHAEKGEPVMIAPGDTAQVGGVMKLKAYDNMYLYITREMDERVVSYLKLVKASAADYQQLEESRFGVQVAFALVYVGIALVLLLCAIWIGIGFANSLVAPIRRLIYAAEQISQGNLNVQVPLHKREGDLANLGGTFNNMSLQLRQQREDLLDANEQIDRRRQFTEAVLSGVTSGVIGTDQDGRISLVNRSAEGLLNVSQSDLLGFKISEAFPEFSDSFDSAMAAEGRTVQDQISLVRDGSDRTFNVRITTEVSLTREHGYVITVDDITDLVSAQRKSAWADVARRIAHEIKNPLTPIQLSAERIRRRYGKRIEDDRTVFDQCVDTIIRQVGDIGRMVDEFSSFARMPKPTFEKRDLVEVVREATFLQTVGHPEIEFVTDYPDDDVYGELDHRLMTQAVTNVVKNAVEAVEAVEGEHQGRIDIVVNEENDDLIVSVSDNGIGLPKEHRYRLLEPYMTTREKGTGLGLAIVGKILEEHGGRVELLDADAESDEQTGAMVRLILPNSERSPKSEPDPASDEIKSKEKRAPEQHGV